MASKIFERLLKQAKPENRQFVEKNLAISKQVRHILASHPSINTQKALADALGKESSEISKWLSGLHNIGLENITKMEAVLGEDIILTVEQAKEKYLNVSVQRFQVFQKIHGEWQTERLRFTPKTIKRNDFSPTRPSKRTKASNKENKLETIY